MKKFDNTWIKEKAKEFTQEDSFHLLSMPSAKKARFLAWEIINEMNKKLPDEEKFNPGITISKLGRNIVSCYCNTKHFSFEYDAETKKAAYSISFEKPINTEEIKKSKEERELQEKIDKLITKKDLELFEKQGDTSEKSMEEITVITKLFNPTGAGTWYLYEKLDDDVYMCFANLGDIEMAELGTVSIKELAEFKGMFGLGIERDKFFEPTNLKEIYDKVKGGIHV